MKIANFFDHVVRRNRLERHLGKNGHWQKITKKLAHKKHGSYIEFKLQKPHSTFKMVENKQNWKAIMKTIHELTMLE